MFFLSKVLRDVSLKRELAIWLDAKLTDIEKRHNLDAKNAALLRSMAIKRLSKFKKSKKVRFSSFFLNANIPKPEKKKSENDILKVIYLSKMIFQNWQKLKN